MEEYIEDDQVAIEDTLEEIMKNDTLDDGDYIQLNSIYIFSICKLAQKVLLKDEILTKIDPPCYIIGDLHAQFNSFRKILSLCESPQNHKFLFLGDYIDRGSNSVEVLTALLCLKLMYPKNVFLIRGNHETMETSSQYGFYQECGDRYNYSLYDEFISVFNNLPMAAIVGNAIFCVHGGISQNLMDVNELKKIERPLQIPKEGFLLDLLWSDPSFVYRDFHNSQRGGSFTYGTDAVEEFLKTNNLKYLCRAHQLVMDGYEYTFGENNHSCISLFSAPNYCGECENKGAVMRVDKDLSFTFTIIDPC